MFESKKIKALEERIKELERMIIEPEKPKSAWAQCAQALSELGQFTKPTRTWSMIKNNKTATDRNKEEVDLILNYFNLEKVKSGTRLRKKKK